MFALIGAFLGGSLFGPLGAFVGANLGSMIDFALWNPESQAGKPLEQLNISSSIEGRKIKYIYGSCRTGLNYAWISPLKRRPIYQTVEQTTFGVFTDEKEVKVGWRYFGSFIGIACHGPIQGISRIWNNDNGELLYDKRIGVSDEVAAKSDEWAAAHELEILYGEDDQGRVSWMGKEIDYAYNNDFESTGGITDWYNVPQYRGYAGIAVRNIDFPNGRIPNLSVEVINSGYIEPSTWDEVVPEGAYWEPRSMAGDAVVKHNDKTKFFFAGGYATEGYHKDLWVTEDMVHWKKLKNMPMQDDHYGYGRFHFDMWGHYISDELRVTIEADANVGINRIAEGNYLYVMGGSYVDGALTKNVGPIVYDRNTDGAVTKYITGFLYNIDEDEWTPIIVHAGDTESDKWGAYQYVVPWPRFAYASANYNGYVYVTGGAVSDSDHYDSVFLNGDANNDAHAENGWFGDTWRSSTGGITWEEVGSIGQFEFRRSHYMVVHKGALYLGGGVSYKDLSNPSEYSNALYKLVGDGGWSLVNINMSSHSCLDISVNSTAGTVQLENDPAQNIDYSELLTVGHEFVLHDTVDHPITTYGPYEIGTITKSGDTVTVTVASGDLSGFQSNTNGVDFDTDGYFESAIFQDEMGVQAPYYSDIWGMAEHGNGLVVLVTDPDTDQLYAAKSQNGGRHFTKLDLQGTVPEYSTPSGFPENNVVSWFNTIYTLGGEAVAGGGGTELLDDIWRIDTPKLGSNAIPLNQVIESICNRRGITNSQLNISSNLENINVLGFASEGQNGDDELNHLRRVYRFDYWEEDAKLTFKLRNRTSDVTIPENDLAATEETNKYQNKLIIEDTPELKLPMQVRLQYIDKEGNYQTGSQISKRIVTDSNDDRVTDANKILDIQVPIVLTSDQAYQAATEILWDMWNTRRQVKFYLSTKYLKYDPGTISTINNGDEQYIVRWRKIDLATPGLIEVTGLITDLQLYDIDLTGVDSDSDPNRQGGDAIITISETTYAFLDIPIIHTKYDDFGFYVAATPTSGNQSNWPGAEVYISRNDGDDYELISEIKSAAYIGETESTIDKKTCFSWDVESELLVKFKHKITLSSKTEAEIMAGQNLFVVGDEIIGVANVEFLGYIEDSSGSSSAYTQYKFTKLARGLFGTEYKRKTHISTGETVVSLNRVYRVPLKASDQSVDLTYKVITKGQKLHEVDTITFHCDSLGRKLPSPAGVDAKRHLDGSWEIWWNRRVRVFDVFDPLDKIDRVDDLTGFAIILYDADGNIFLASQPIYQIDSNEPRIKLTVDDIYYSLPLKEFQVRIHQLSKTHGYSEPVQAKINLNGKFKEDHPDFLTDPATVF